MTFSDIDWTNNHYKLVFTSGELEGLFIDFTYQEVGFRDNVPQRFEYRKSLIIRYLLEHSDDYMTGAQINLIEELNSIDVSKAISSFKSCVIKALAPTYDREEGAELFNQIIDRKKSNGQMGYRFLTDGTELIDCDEAVPTDAALENMTAATVITDDTTDMKISVLSDYFKKNWFVIFILFYIILMLLFVMNGKDMSIGSLYRNMIEASLMYNFVFFLIVGIAPVLAGILIDTPISLITHRLKTGRKASASEIHNIVMYEVPRFDLSMRHIFFFSVCNVTGAMTTVAAIFFVRGIPYFSEYITKSSLTIPLSIIAFAGLLTGFYNNYALQTKVEPARNNKNYILTRAHAVLNVLYLSLSLTVSCSLLFAFLLFRFNSSYATPDTLDSSFLILILSTYSFMWFSADSPMADEIDSISRYNFLSGAPVLTFFAIVYTILCYDKSFTCFLSFAINAIVLGVWALLMFKKKSVSLVKLVTSFFSVMAVAVITLLVINM
ncbi:MAG: hypothetical protein IJ053_03835 [Lachnospiraceae bacterium]|nr:hypothetical protein [Lachnospiraceae bacterium]